MAESPASQDEALARGVEQAQIAQENWIAANAGSRGASAEEKLAALRLGIESALKKTGRAKPGTYNPIYVQGQQDGLHHVLRAMKEMGA